MKNGKRKPLIAGNWKMYKNLDEAVDLARKLKNSLSMIRDIEVVLIPPFPLIYSVRKALGDDSLIKAGAQDSSGNKEGAYTGDVSAGMLSSIGCSYVLAGHSERREYHLETDGQISCKVRAIIDAGLSVILCMGESLAERDANRVFEKIDRQVREDLKTVKQEEFSHIVIAYEPIWAIGTGRTATPAQAQEVHAHIRSLIGSLFGENNASNLRILYGGSVKPENIKELMAQDDIDGALVGGASLNAESFSRIVKFRNA
jgi:triosephosphate isomerase